MLSTEAIAAVVAREFDAARMRSVASVLHQDPQADFAVVVAIVAAQAAQVGRELGALHAAILEIEAGERGIRAMLDREPDTKIRARLLELATLYRLGEMR